MRLVILTTSFPSSAEDPSGHFVRSAALRLASAHHEVHVIAAGGSPFAPPVHDGPLVVHRAGGASLFAWPGAIARAREAPWRLAGAGVLAAGAYARLRAIGRVDRAIAHWIVPCAFPLASAVRAPLDVVAHGADVRLLIRSPRVARSLVIERLVARDARFTFAAAALLSAMVESLDSPLARALASRAHVEPPPIDVPDVAAHAAALRSSLGLASHERLAVTAGRLVSSKRVHLAIEAVAKTQDVRLVVIGDGPERSDLSKRAAALGLAVTFTGALPRRDALAWIAAADVLVHASAIEAAPTVVREARAVGVRVVACDAGDVTAWARDDAGIHVVDANADAIARAIASRAS